MTILWKSAQNPEYSDTFESRVSGEDSNRTGGHCGEFVSLSY